MKRSYSILLDTLRLQHLIFLYIVFCFCFCTYVPTARLARPAALNKHVSMVMAFDMFLFTKHPPPLCFLFVRVCSPVEQGAVNSVGQVCHGGEERQTEAGPARCPVSPVRNGPEDHERALQAGRRGGGGCGYEGVRLGFFFGGGGGGFS